jgi:glucosamine 6-phosphate synthetase-like amidotransferase/phosphosugar isomerase protein
LKEAMNVLTHKLNGIQSAITKYVEDKTLWVFLNALIVKKEQQTLLSQDYQMTFALEGEGHAHFVGKDSQLMNI